MFSCIYNLKFTFDVDKYGPLHAAQSNESLWTGSNGGNCHTTFHLERCNNSKCDCSGGLPQVHLQVSTILPGALNNLCFVMAPVYVGSRIGMNARLRMFIRRHLTVYSMQMYIIPIYPRLNENTQALLLFLS